MIKTVLVALNAKYVHSSLALRYLEKYSKEFFVEIAEYSINDNLHTIYSSLVKKQAVVYAFSCYIWNIELTLKITQMLKKAKPEAKIILGGPEVSYTADIFMKHYKHIDGIIVGEGEQTLHSLLKKLNSGISFDYLPSIPGLYVRNKDFIPGQPMELSLITQPYSDKDIENLKGKIIYFETSRGCPFNCSFCLSSNEKNVRPFPMEYVKKGLGFLLDKNVPLIKLIDRTFNYNNSRAIEIIKYIIEKNKCSCIHMELEPRILSIELIDILNSAPKGMFQVEMGIQSLNHKTLSAIGREYDEIKTADNIKRLKQSGKIHIHLDLIAGLPYEDMESFKNSFNYVYSLKPDMLQLGFLKVLKGTDIEKDNDIISLDFPPHEVISTKWLSAEEICSIKQTEEAVETFYNSNAFSNTLDKIMQSDPYYEFEKLGKLLVKWQKNGKIKRSKLYQLIFDTYGTKLREALSIDFIKNNKGVPLPDFTNPKREKGFKDKTYKLLKEEWFCEKYGIQPDLSNVRFERINNKAYMMDYKNNNLFDISDEIE